MTWSVLLCLLGVTGCSFLPWKSPQELLGGSRRATIEEAARKTYQLKAGDTVKISVWEHEDLQGIEVQIREDGYLVFPLIGRAKVIGLSLEDAENQLYEALNAGYIIEPQVSIQLAYAKFTVLGEVRRPGSFEIVGAMDLLTALSLAGGISKFGSGALEVIREDETSGTISIRVDINAILSGQKPNLSIFPNDTIYVRRRVF